MEMSQEKISFRTDSEDKREFEEFVSSLGLTTSSALNLVIKSALREKRLPVTLSLAPQMPPAEREEVTAILLERHKYSRSKDAVRISNEEIGKKLGVL